MKYAEMETILRYALIAYKYCSIYVHFDGLILH